MVDPPNVFTPKFPQLTKILLDHQNQIQILTNEKKIIIIKKMVPYETYQSNKPRITKRQLELNDKLQRVSLTAVDEDSFKPSPPSLIFTFFIHSIAPQAHII